MYPDLSSTLERRLTRGPLKVRTLWDEEKTEALPGRVLARRRRSFAKQSVLVAFVGVTLGFFGVSETGIKPWAKGLAAEQSKIEEHVTSVGLRTSVEQRASPDLRPPPAPGKKDAPRLLHWKDGSEIRLSEGARVVGPEINGDHTEAELTRGKAVFLFAPRQARTLSVSSGSVSVTTSRAEVELEQQDGRVRIRVRDGRVRVSWKGVLGEMQTGHADLSRGEEGWFPPNSTEAEAEAEPGPATELTPARTTPKASSNPSERDERDLEAHGEALPRSAKQLMTAADAARKGQRLKDAAHLLLRLENEFPSSPEAPLAAFTRGRLLLEGMNSPKAAADAFAQARRLAPKGSLAADALVREIGARVSAGQGSQARALARECLAAYPSGRHAAPCKNLVSPSPR